ncbi:MAG: stage II sporulation protein M [Gammaproteobacteria bacterium]|nr:stage II sporulation protein M [Gammaproteobacteria bacterium]
MKQQAFEQAHGVFWQAFEADLLLLEQGKSLGQEAAKALPARYRQICQHLSLARSRHYSPRLAERLNELVLRGHQQLYRSGRPLLAQVGHFLLAGFPAQVRAEARLFWLALGLFALPLGLAGLACFYSPEFIYSLMPELQVDQMERMYDPAKRALGRERESDTDVYMFGYYLMHNTGLGFQTFAGGMLYGVGSVFYLLYNGLILGGVAGHLSRLGYTGTFWPFVAGHGAFELTAIVLAGQAGLKLGAALLMPGLITRGAALKLAARPCVTLILGSALFFLVAAFIEAFWSSSAALPAALKYAVAGGLWAFVIAYLARAGREASHGA